MIEDKKILILSISAWNSKVGSNTWASLVKTFNPNNIANISLREEVPNSPACNNYFSISENRVIKSIFNRKIKTGREVCPQIGEEQIINEDLIVHNERYNKLKRKKRRYSLLLVRELLWKLGRWKTPELNRFIDEFNPDVILYSMEGYIHLNRIIKYAIKRTGAKAIGYFWDDNFTYKQSRRLGYKIYRLFQRKSLKSLAKKTQEFFAITPKTKKEADKCFGVDCVVLSKPLNAIPIAENYEKLNKPLKMLYTGNLLIGRDNSLIKISQALNKINATERLIELEVYTQTVLPEEKLKLINSEFCMVREPIAQQEVLKKQAEADVLLFLEDVGKKILMARLSFSTKITDYLSTGKCIFAVGNKTLAPMEYFEQTKSAIIASNDEEILLGLKSLLDTDVLKETAKNATDVAIENHSPERIEEIFNKIINKVVNESITN